MLLIIGGTGLLGPYLVAASHHRGLPVMVVGQRSGDIRLDATDRAALSEVIKDTQPSTIINCAALTDVDRCEADPDAATRLNITIPTNLAASAPATTRLIQISTDQVYPGEAGPYREEAVGPVNVYGRTKLEGEEAILAHPNAVALRSNFFGPSRTTGRLSLSDWMEARFDSGEPFTLFGDNWFSPLHMQTLAEAALDMAARPETGAFNLGSRDGMSKAEFGVALAQTLGMAHAHAEVGPSVSIPGRAKRPADMRMDVTKVESILGSRMPTLLDEINAVARAAVSSNALPK